MKTTTVFKIGNSVCVRLPAGFKLPIGKVYISQDETGIRLRSTKNDWPVDIFEIFAPDPLLDDWNRPEQGDIPAIKNL